jgi:hypothetical protein
LQIRNITGETIQRNLLIIYAKVVDINFIKFEFTCELCNNGTLLSFTKCINYCRVPRPKLNLVMRVTIQDQHDANNSEAFISLKDEHCFKVFGISSACMDVFKEYFFMHGVFYYKSA